MHGHVNLCSNNAMEFTAIICVSRDSSYIRNGLTTSIHTCMGNGRRPSQKRQIANLILWNSLDDAVVRPTEFLVMLPKKGETDNKSCAGGYRLRDL
jgi:ribonuclease HI